ncbi:cohesin domain-containing protein [Tenacibaculum xiamenense]|uniref:cohesin domain-containing protein n=1 Tax=Tenacibaculum xiamenense TaxID=1261553 RepID=UPI00389583CC
MKNKLHRKITILLLIAFGLLSARTSAQLHFSIENVPTSTGEIVEIPVSVKNFNEVVGFQLEIQIPSEKIEFVEISRINSELIGFESRNYNYHSNGKLNVLWADLQFQNHTISNDDILFHLKVKVLAPDRDMFTIDFNVSKAANKLGQPMETITDSAEIQVGAIQFLVEDQVVGVGTTFTVPVRAKNMIDVAGFQLKVEFPGGNADFVSIQDINPALTSFGSQSFYSPSDGVVNIVWDHPELINTAIDNEELLFNLVLKGDTSAADFDVKIHQIYAFDNQPELIPSIESSATIMIKDFIQVTGKVTNEIGEGLPYTEVTLSNNFNNDLQTTEANGIFDFSVVPGQNFLLTPNKDAETIDGINVADILVVRKHLLGRELLPSPYKIIAADTDNNEILNVGDIIVLRRLILGTLNSLYKDWCFVPKNYVFPNNQNPFENVYPQSISYPELTANQLDQDFIAIKIGDVNDDHDVNVRERQMDTQLLMESQNVSKGEVIRIPVNVEDSYIDIAGWQGTIEFDPEALSFVRVDQGEIEVTEAHFNTELTLQGKIPFAYDQKESQGESINNGASLFYLVFEVIGESGDSSKVSFSSSKVPMMTFSSQLNKSELSVKEANIVINPENLHLSVYPNPGRNFNIKLHNTKAEMLTMKITNVSGSIIHEETRRVSRGGNNIHYDAKLLSPGVYFIECILENQKVIKKIIVN